MSCTVDGPAYLNSDDTRDDNRCYLQLFSRVSVAKRPASANFESSSYILQSGGSSVTLQSSPCGDRKARGVVIFLITGIVKRTLVRRV